MFCDWMSVSDDWSFFRFLSFFLAFLSFFLCFFLSFFLCDLFFFSLRLSLPLFPFCFASHSSRSFLSIVLVFLLYFLLACCLSRLLLFVTHFPHYFQQRRVVVVAMNPDGVKSKSGTGEIIFNSFCTFSRCVWSGRTTVEWEGRSDSTCDASAEAVHVDSLE